VRDLLGQVFFLGGRRGPRDEPPAGTLIEQPAAAALALRKEVLEELGGFDEGFFPAWFEDVDLAKRMHEKSHFAAYLPASRFRHAAGSSLPALGYGPFLFVYYRHLCRYLRKHHGRGAALLARFLLPISMTLRLLLLPLRKPNRAKTRGEAAAGLAAVAIGALTGFRYPRVLADRFRRAPPGH
jgi:GT2 family glycosyltransferase